MAFRSLFTALTDEDSAPETLRTARTIAERSEAHLDVLCLGIDHTQVGGYDLGGGMLLSDASWSQAMSSGKALGGLAQVALAQAQCGWSVETGAANILELGRGIARRARFSDVVIASQPRGDTALDAETIVEGALFDGQSAVLVTPQGADVSQAPKTVILAWNESAEALNATRAALPLLIDADQVHITIIDPPRHGPTRSDPGGSLAQYLARHGARADINVLAKSLPRTSDVMLRHISDTGADMVVMGAYGHSRFREAILGGATRDMLDQSPVPLFLKH